MVHFQDKNYLAISVQEYVKDLYYYSKLVQLVTITII